MKQLFIGCGIVVLIMIVLCFAGALLLRYIDLGGLLLTPEEMRPDATELPESTELDALARTIFDQQNLMESRVSAINRLEAHIEADEERVFQILAQASGDTFYPVRVAAAGMLYDIAGDRAIPVIHETIEEAQKESRNAIRALGKLGRHYDVAMEAIRSSLTDPSLAPSIRVQWIAAAYASARAEHLDALEELTKHQSPEVRGQAYHAISIIDSRQRSRERTAVFIRGLEDDHPAVLQPVLSALTSGRAWELPGDVKERIRELKGHPDESVRRQAQFSFIIVSGMNVEEVGTLTNLLDSGFASTRERAALTLGHHGAAAQPALPRLRELAADENLDDQVRERARQAIERIELAAAEEDPQRKRLFAEIPRSVDRYQKAMSDWANGYWNHFPGDTQAETIQAAEVIPGTPTRLLVLGPPASGDRRVHIVGNNETLGNWTPNSVALSPTGEYLDMAVWTYEMRWDPGTEFKLTYGSPGAPWEGSEEWSGQYNRRLPDSDLVQRLEDGTVVVPLLFGWSTRTVHRED